MFLILWVFTCLQLFSITHLWWRVIKLETCISPHYGANFQVKMVKQFEKKFPTFSMHSLSADEHHFPNSWANYKHLPAVRRTLCAEGCQWTMPTLLWWPTRSTMGSFRFLVSPPSGICHTLTVQSSEPLAMTSSLCGHHWMSRTAALWPDTNGASRSILPVWKN